MPALAQKCIASWKKYCPNYKIIEWNEHNFDLKRNSYIKEAFSVKKWAFVTDYVRLFVLYHKGGIYMDTDVEVLRPLDGFLNHSAFSGFESNNSIPTGIIAGEAGNKWLKRLLDDYSSRYFILPDGNLDMTTNVTTITNITKDLYNIELNNTFQELNDGLVFYPSEYFCPKNYSTGAINTTDDSYCIHHFAGSWLLGEKKLYGHKRNVIYRYFGKNIFSWCMIRLLFFTMSIRNIGLLKTIKKYYTLLYKKLIQNPKFKNEA